MNTDKSTVTMALAAAIALAVPTLGQVVTNPCIKNDPAATFQTCKRSGPKATTCHPSLNVSWACVWMQVHTDECTHADPAPSGKQSSDPYTGQCVYQSFTCGDTKPQCNASVNVTITYQCSREAGGACPSSSGGGGGQSQPIDEGN